MRRIFLILLLLALAVPLSASHADRLYLEGGVTRDGDESGHYRLMSGYRYQLPGEGSWEIEAAGGNRHYWEKIPYVMGTGTTTRRETEAFSVAHLALRGATPEVWRYDLQLNQLLSSDWDVLLGAASVSARPNKRWYFELFGERELVDTVRAIRTHTRFETYGVSADYQMHRSWVLVAALLQQEFSDGNRRQGGVARLIYSPRSFGWLHLQLKGRLLDAEQPSDTYFSPERLQEYFLLVGIAAPFANDNWIFRLLAGPGTQVIEPFASERENKEAYLAELHLRGWFSDHVTLESSAGCSTAISSQDNYAYCYGQLHLGYAW